MEGIKPKRKVAPTLLSYIIAFTYIWIIVCIIDFIISKDIIHLIEIGVIIIVDLICNFAFAWYTYAELYLNNNDTLIYKVHTNVNVMGTNYTEYKVKLDEISSFKIKGNKVIVYGKISRKEPKMKPKYDKKMVILDVNDDIKEWIKETIDAKFNSSNG